MINSTTYTFQCLDKKVIELWFWEYTSLHRDILCIKENDTKNGKSRFSRQNREFSILHISWKRYIFFFNECDFCNQHNIFVLEKLVTTGMWHENVKIHRVICPWFCKKLHLPLRFVIFFVISFDDRFINLYISVPWWKGNWILILGLYFFTPRNTFILAKWQEKREIPFSHISIGTSRSSRYLLNG